MSRQVYAAVTKSGLGLCNRLSHHGQSREFTYRPPGGFGHRPVSIIDVLGVGSLACMS